MKHKTKVPKKGIKVRHMAGGRRNKIKLHAHNNICYHIYPHESKKVYLELWAGGANDKQLALAWLAADVCSLLIYVPEGKWTLYDEQWGNQTYWENFADQQMLVTMHTINKLKAKRLSHWK